MRYANLLLDQYDALGHNVRKELRRGIAERTLLGKFKRFLKQPHPVNDPIFPQTLPTTLIQLYGWHNGGGELIPYTDFVDFDTALSWWDISSEAAEDSVLYENGNAVFADTSPFPFMVDGGGDMVVMDVGESSPTRGSIGYFANNGCSSVRNEFATLSQFFRGHYQCCKEGVYTVGEHGLDFEGRRKPLERFRSKDMRTTNGASVGW